MKLADNAVRPKRLQAPREEFSSERHARSEWRKQAPDPAIQKFPLQQVLAVQNESPGRFRRQTRGNRRQSGRVPLGLNSAAAKLHALPPPRASPRIFAARLTATGQVVNPGTPEEFAAAIDDQMATVKHIGETLGIKPSP